MLNVMAVAREEISYGEFLAIFRESDEENDEILDADASDFDEDIFVCNLSNSEEGETSEDEAEEDEWNNACDLTFKALAFLLSWEFKFLFRKILRHFFSFKVYLTTIS